MEQKENTFGLDHAGPCGDRNEGEDAGGFGDDGNFALTPWQMECHGDLPAQGCVVLPFGAHRFRGALQACHQSHERFVIFRRKGIEQTVLE